MDTSTAKGLESGCGSDEACCGWNVDTDALRGANRTCSIYGDPNFGVADFDWDLRHVHLSIRRGDGGGVALGADGIPIEVTVDIDTCQAVDN